MAWSADGSMAGSYAGTSVGSADGRGFGPDPGGGRYDASAYGVQSPPSLEMERHMGAVGPARGGGVDTERGIERQTTSKRWGVRGNRRILGMLALLGLGTLLPFNILVNSVDYLDFLYPDQHMEYYLAIAFALPQPVIMWLTTRCKKHWDSPGSATSAFIVMMFVSQAMVMLAVPLSARFLPRAHERFIILASGVFFGGTSCLLQPSLFSFSSILPAQYVRAMMAGQASSAIFAVLIRAVTKATVARAHDSALAFFAVAAAVLLFCAIMFVCLRQQPMTRYLYAKHASGSMLVEDDLMSITVSEYSDDGEGRAPVTYWSVMSKMRTQCAGLFVVLVVTFMLYPGMLTSMWYHGSWAPLSLPHMSSWWPTIMIGIACAFDVVGRLLSGYLSRCVGPRGVLAIGLLRTAFIPAFVYYNQGADRALFGDMDAFLFVAVYALSNSSLVTIVMSPPAGTFTEAEKGMASWVLLTVFRGSIFLGSISALGIRRLRLPAFRQ